MHVEILKLSAYVYSPYRPHQMGGSRRARARLGLETGMLYLARTQGDHIQAGLDWLTASLGQLTGMFLLAGKESDMR